MLRRSVVLLALVAALLLALAAPSFAHVHGINPLNCTPANANAGGNVAFDKSDARPLTPAEDTPPVIPILAGGAVEIRDDSQFGVCRA